MRTPYDIQQCRQMQGGIELGIDHRLNVNVIIRIEGMDIAVPFTADGATELATKLLQMSAQSRQMALLRQQ